MRKFKVGTPVRVNRYTSKWHRAHLDIFHVAKKVEASAALMWATSDIERPTGRVIKGNPHSPLDTVHVRLSNRFGSDECYMEKNNLTKKRVRK